MSIPPLDEINKTPALYALIDHTPRKRIDSRWDDIFAPILREERKLHEFAWESSVFARNKHHNSKFGFKIFIASLEYDAFTDDHDSIRSDALEAVFMTYWDLFLDESVNSMPTYEDSIEKWHNSNPHKVEWCIEQLNQS
jgi:hypothetical protein